MAWRILVLRAEYIAAGPSEDDARSWQLSPFAPKAKLLGPRRRYQGVNPRPLLAVGALVLALVSAPTAVGQDPPFVGWSALLPGLALPYDPPNPDDCIAGRSQCVDKTIRQMTARFDPLAASCDHNAIFALTYLRVTQDYRRTIAAPFFDDTPFVNHEDTVFAHYYFAAFDDWTAGQIDDVPPAWRIAFDAAARHEVSGSGDLLLGINAHVQRDLPLVLYSIGLVARNGSSRKPDHDRVNIILNRVEDDVIAEIARRFDPTIDDANLPTSLDDAALFQLLAGWREDAWRSAEALAAAPTPQARDLVVSQIESNAATEARAIVASTAYPPFSGGSGPRDAYCAIHHADP
jgi:Family of unknown function (DUF5995)